MWADAFNVADDELDIARLAFTIAQGEYPDLDVDAQLQRLDDLAAQIPTTNHGLEGLRELLFEQLGFRGNDSNYYDARNSYLNDVLDRRMGIPITLSAVYLELGWRIGLDLAPISFPGHFLVRFRDPHRSSDGAPTEVFIDVFRQAETPSRTALVQRLEQIFGGRVGPGLDLEQVFTPCSRREVVARMLRNLKQIYVQAKDWERALRVSDQLLHAEPTLAPHYRDRGFLYAQVGHNEAAMADCRRYLGMVPKAQDATQVRALLTRCAAGSTRLN